MSRDLGFRYIWIDSICIIQDDKRDWEEQSSQSKNSSERYSIESLNSLIQYYSVASVYSNAELVLAAARASSAEEGFLQQNRFAKESSIDIQPRSGRGPSLHLKYRVGPQLYTENDRDSDPLEWDPLNTRGWALQERVLARRYLSFGRRELSWTVSDFLQIKI